MNHHKAPVARWLTLALMAVLLAGVVARAADDLTTARELYASAAYEEALDTLDRVHTGSLPIADAFAVAQYRAFCLLALGRGSEAQSAIEALVTANPLYQPSAEVSPRVRTAFSDVRRRLLPSLIQGEYGKAKAKFDKKDYPAAEAGFGEVLRVMADPEVAELASQPPLSDMRTLAAGFKELSAKAIPLPPPPAPAPAPAPAPLVTPVVVPAPPPAPPRVYTGVEPKVVPPAALQQELPSYTGRPLLSAAGALEVVIDERGLVESATMRQSASASYDRLVVDATKSWRYRPATVDGVPVKFRKVISIAVKPAA